ncbi:ABC transporter substrate-binding protein [Pseudodesulfovibrio cashew]|uniref:ABC transporter substrate-binding protein n=1 Tax=Pseudodesulfovibrio cashew TaxID=2678688 RepID=A0A6I6JEN8_9BACT|nr:ABC transporter substrate-binding protein [Pseudodesulfovibrio cashew]QGY39629.1 ABC transporter substrate-binding protein [Pseudodesulfovibrio cashew]
MSRTVLTLIVVCLALALVLGGCNATSEDTIGKKGVPGVTDTEIRLGSSLALTGHAGYLGTQTLRGALAYLRWVNEAGGIYGRKITIKAEDDSYDPPRCLANTQHFIIDNNVFALFCYVGTPTTVKVLPMVEEARIPLIGMFTGANGLREPFNRYVVNIRASYYQETGAAVRHLVQDLGIKKIAVFYQYDAYGFDGLVGTELALKEFHLEPVARGSYIRGTQDVTEGFNKIAASGAEAVVMVGTYGACARFIRLAKRHEFSPIFYNVSFVGAEELARRIGPGAPPVLMSQVVPQPKELGDPDDAAVQYVTLLERFYPGETPSFVGLEGFLNARILVEGLRRAGPDLTREKFIDAIASLHNYELGSGMTVTYGKHDRQGLEDVHFTRLVNGRFIPFTDWNVIRQQREAR